MHCGVWGSVTTHYRLPMDGNPELTEHAYTALKAKAKNENSVIIISSLRADESQVKSATLFYSEAPEIFCGDNDTTPDFLSSWREEMMAEFFLIIG